MAFDENTKLKDLMANPEANSILEKYLPNGSSNPQLNMVKNFSLKTIAGFPQAGIKQDTLKAIVAELATIG